MYYCKQLIFFNNSSNDFLDIGFFPKALNPFASHSSWDKVSACI